MSVLAKRELLVQVAPRYVEGCRHQRRIILDEFVAATGYDRKYAIRLLNSPVRPPLVIQRRRAPQYGAAVQEALMVVWRAANGICSKRLIPFLLELVPILERHGHLSLDDGVRAQLLSMSAATADRIVRRLRETDRPHGISTTKPGRLLKRQVPVRTFGEWDDLRPGFFEADLVAHCGGSTDGSFLYTLCLTDVATGWTECLPLLHRIPSEVVQAVRQVRRLLPFPLLGFDSDNGHEFINFELVAYCEQEQITFTRGRVANKNDQCFIEQKNGSIVRQLVGYDRFEGQRAYRQLAELYRAVRLYVNFFQPSIKLRTKRRTGAHVCRTYHPAQTPFQRLLASGVLSPTACQRLEGIYQALDPVRLLRQLETLQDALWRHAVYRTHGTQVGYAHARAELVDVTFEVTTCGLGVDGNVADDTPPAVVRRGAAPPTPHRKYRRTKKSLGPRTYRTRKDPFESVWDEIRGWLEVEPERTVKSVFVQLQDKYPDQYPDCQLRTLHRHVATWRAGVILTFDEQWLANDALAGQPLPRPLRASAEPHTELPIEGEQSA
jgi:hypothetical protein